MKLLILGGVRSGKSRFAEERARRTGKPVTYVATASTAFADDEMHARIEKHRLHRPPDWQLIEETHDLARLIREHKAASVLLIECLTLWLTNLLIDEAPVLAPAREAFLEALAESAGDVIMVSNEVGWGTIPQNALSRRFVDEAGTLHQAVARHCDEVVLVAAGLPLTLKPGNLQ
ncbi:bifunctional adenosylcobinamide kinase/adenosylcobinamide-phosphate guanylyltransferase [Granulosicoccaceae sp. 1_MG-2023]|nr:bifunctional adenosylcobinamide kinase/adenosylcobinamide-phosphate guanylyltransferase [Granulosicoccaceae sp. 1_MG-2023]